MTYKKGSLVWITCEGRKVAGEVILASENQVSLMLEFEAMLTGHVGMMPVLLHEDGGVPVDHRHGGGGDRADGGTTDAP